MDLQEFRERFSPLSTQEKIKFLHAHIESLALEEKRVFLLSLIKDEVVSPIIRASALKLLTIFGLEDSETLQKCLEAHHPALVKAAQKGWKEYEKKERKNAAMAESFLKKISDTRDKEKKLKILRAIGRLDAPWVITVFLEMLAEPTEAIRNFAVEELGKRESLRLELVYNKLFMPPWFSKCAALKILGKKKNPQSVKVIVRLIDDVNIDVRRNVACALGEIGGKDVPPLLVRLSRDPSRYVRLAAEEALRKASEIRFS